jgi:hypothetical protein
METELTHFLEAFAQEEFESGRRWARTYLAKQSKDVLSYVLKLEDDSSNLTSDYIEKLSPELRLVVFADLYFDARIQIETSYHYRQACRKIENAKPLLDCMEDEACPILMGVLRHVCDFQKHLCDIDRSLYADDPDKLIAPCEALSQSVEQAKSSANGIYSPWKDLYEAYLLPSIQSNLLFSQNMVLLAKAHSSKWDKNNHADKTEALIEKVSDNIKALRQNGAEIQASEIIPSLRSLVEFHNNKQGHSPLIVKNGDVKTIFFAIMEPCLMPVLSQAIEGELFNKAKPAINLGNIKCSQPDRESLSDIWNSILNDVSPHEYRWALSDIVLNQDENNMTSQVDLVYSKLGFWRVEITTNVNDLPASDFKQIGVLATPYSLDSDLQLQAKSGVTKKYAFLSDFIEDVFSELESCLRAYQEDEKLSIYGVRTLEWSLDRNWFVLENVQRIREANNNTQSLTAASFTKSLSFKELALPSREVRAALSGWIFREPPASDKNLAPIRYNNEEVIFVMRNHAFIGLLEQPDWVNYQAKDSILLCAAIAHMVDLTAQKVTLNETEYGKKVSKLSSQKLKEDITAIELLETHIDNILSIIKGGHIMTYADHSQFIDASLDEFELGKTYQHLEHVLESSKSKRELRILEIERRHKIWIKRAITVGTAFLTIGAVGEVFQIVDDMDLMEYSIPPLAQLAFLGVCFVLVLIVGFISSGKSDH